MDTRSLSVAALAVAATLSAPPLARAQSPVQPLTYHGGPVMTAFTAYTIFWAPAPQFAIPATYETLVNRWFTDVGGSPLLDVVTQYAQNTPPSYPLATPTNAATLGGTWVDTTNPYPHAGTVADPLFDADIRAEVARAITANGWPDGGLDVEFFVYTAFGVESCAAPGFCTPGIAPLPNYYCGYHSSYTDGATSVIYANMPYVATWNCIAEAGITVSPNGDLDADKEIKITSHEQFDSITDPLQNAWFDASGQEVADKCQFFYAPTAPDGRNLTLNGNPYVVQEEWSNLAFNGASFSGCAFGPCAQTPQPSCAKPVKAGGAVVLKQNADPSKKTLTWPSAKSAVKPLGDPTSDTSYALCIYDETTGMPGLVMAVMAPVGAHWAAKGSGFTYSDKAETSDGVKQLVLGPRPSGTTKIKLAGKGARLPLPALPLNDSPGVTVQLVNSAGSCWEVDYPAPAKVNTTAQFKASAR